LGELAHHNIGVGGQVSQGVEGFYLNLHGDLRVIQLLQQERHKEIQILGSNFMVLNDDLSDQVQSLSLAMALAAIQLHLQGNFSDRDQVLDLALELTHAHQGA